MQVRDVRVIERRERLRFAFETRASVAIAGDRGRQDLEGDIATEPGIAGAIHLAHASGADGTLDFINANASART